MCVNEGLWVMWWKIGFIIAGFLVESLMQGFLEEEGAKSIKDNAI